MAENNINYCLFITEDDAHQTKDFEKIIYERINFATKHGSYIFKIEFKVKQDNNSNSNFTALEILIPISSSYDGYSNDEAVNLILKYIKLEIKRQYLFLLTSQKYKLENVETITDAINFLSNNSLAKDIDFSATELSDDEKKSIIFINKARTLINF